jgi:MSHA biogenesis protein MshJ
VRALLQRYAERIDAATLRERALIFAAAALVLIAMVNMLVLDPLWARETILTQRVAQLQGELKTVQGQQQAIVRGGNPDDAAQKRLAELTRRMKEINSAVTKEQSRFTPPDRVRHVLAEMLERNRRLELVDLKTLPATTLERAGGPAGRRVYEHGVEITVGGSFFDLQNYLVQLEHQPLQIYWGRAELAAAGYPKCTLKLTVFTLSFDKDWLIV